MLYKFQYRLGLFLFTLILFFSCKKEDNKVGVSVLPDSDLLSTSYTDTVTIKSVTVKSDSILSDETSISLLGSYYDPVFGKTATSIYTQVLLPSGITNLNFGSDLALDSVVLTLPYNGKYYGSLDALGIKVFEVTESFYKDSTYYSTKTLQQNLQAIADTAIIPKPTDSVLVNNTKLGPHMRIKLSNTFGNAILGQSGMATLSDNTSFLNYLKGIHITASNIADNSGTGSLLYLNLNDAIAGITIYYRRNSSNPTVGDTVNVKFAINSAAARFNRFTHDYSFASSTVLNQITKADTSSGLQNIYLQAMAGLNGKIYFPYLKNLIASQKIAINNAELTLKIDPSTIGIYSVPAKLTLIRKDASNKQYLLPDEDYNQNGVPDQSSTIKGDFDAAKNQYQFFIPIYMQQLLEDKLPNNGLHVVVSGNAVNANRLVLGGGNNSTYKMQLKLTYTKVD